MPSRQSATTKRINEVLGIPVRESAQGVRAASPVANEVYIRLPRFSVGQTLQNLHQLGHTLCRVELLEGSFFEADMILTDRVDPDWSYTKSLPHIRNYWDGKVSEDPLHEVVIQGRFRMLPLD